MSNARIDRMVRELNSEPSVQFFQGFFGLIGLGKAPAKTKIGERAVPSLQRVQGGVA